jgi:uncharacterized protein with HEPN domain
VPSRNWLIRLQDIAASITEVQQRTNSFTFEEFVSNQTIIKAVLYDFIVIGEAARNIPIEIQSRYPMIPWRLMGAMRNAVVHEYFQINLGSIWETIHNDLPILLLQLQEIIAIEVSRE